jgi:hypothetical protein
MQGAARVLPQPHAPGRKELRPPQQQRCQRRLGAPQTLFVRWSSAMCLQVKLPSCPCTQWISGNPCDRTAVPCRDVCRHAWAFRQRAGLCGASVCCSWCMSELSSTCGRCEDAQSGRTAWRRPAGGPSGGEAQGGAARQTLCAAPVRAPGQEAGPGACGVRGRERGSERLPQARAVCGQAMHPEQAVLRGLRAPGAGQPDQAPDGAVRRQQPRQRQQPPGARERARQRPRQRLRQAARRARAALAARGRHAGGACHTSCWAPGRPDALRGPSAPALPSRRAPACAAQAAHAPVAARRAPRAPVGALRAAVRPAGAGRRVRRSAGQACAARRHAPRRACRRVGARTQSGGHRRRRQGARCPVRDWRAAVEECPNCILCMQQRPPCLQCRALRAACATCVAAWLASRVRHEGLPGHRKPQGAQLHRNHPRFLCADADTGRKPPVGTHRSLPALPIVLGARQDRS